MLREIAKWFHMGESFWKGEMGCNSCLDHLLENKHHFRNFSPSKKAIIRNLANHKSLNFFLGVIYIKLQQKDTKTSSKNTCQVQPSEKEADRLPVHQFSSAKIAVSFKEGTQGSLHITNPNNGLSQEKSLEIIPPGE